MTAPIVVKAYDRPHACIGRSIQEVVRIANANLGHVSETASDQQRKIPHPVKGGDWTLRVRTIRGVVVKVGRD